MEAVCQAWMIWLDFEWRPHSSLKHDAVHRNAQTPRIGQGVAENVT